MASSAAAPQHRDGVALVRFKPGVSAAEKALARQSADALADKAYTLVPGLERVGLKAGKSVESAVAALSKNPHVLYAEPDYVLTASVLPNDPSYSSLWGMAKINAPTAWNVSTGSSNVVVGVIDTGIDYNHPDLAANAWVNPGETASNGLDDDGNGYVDDVRGWDFVSNDNNPFDDHSHGTHVAGTIGAVGNNGVGVVGVNWTVKVAALKFLNAQGSGSTSDAVEALQYATTKGFRITNNSWGGGGFSQPLFDAINAARTAGSLFVAAAGNSTTNNDTTPHYPSSYALDNVIAVASTTSTDGISSFSSFGATSVDLGGPGSSILSTTPNNTYSTFSGTSMATPHVAGGAALVLAVNPSWTYGQVRDRLFCTTRPLASLAGKTVTGGILDVGAALGPTTCGAPPPPQALHVSALIVTATKVNGKRISGTATVTVKNGANPSVVVGSVTVTGDWSYNGAYWKTSLGTTNGSGVATIGSGTRRGGSGNTVRFCVTNLTLAGSTYAPAANNPNPPCLTATVP